MQQLGNQLRERRQSLGLTLADVAQASGVTRGYLSMIENHRVENPPSGKVLAKLGAVLELSPDDLERAAQWERTPPAIRARLAEAEERANRGRALAQWLRQVSSKRERGTGKDLDALYRSGQLGRRVNTVLGRGSAQPEADAAHRQHEQNPLAKPAPASQVGPAGGRRGSGWPVPGAGPGDARAGSGSSSVPLINKVAAGYPAGFTDLDYPARVGDGMVVVPGYTGVHGGDDPDAFAATVCGASMQPAYREGDIVVFSPLADVVDGCDCFVRLEPDHETTFKRVFMDEDAGRIRLQPLNPEFEPRTVDREQVAGMFRAVWRMSRL
ncbi:MAG: helix-turn-helix domain-containing protein [Phycisphaerales bacterium JB063]